MKLFEFIISMCLLFVGIAIVTVKLLGYDADANTGLLLMILATQPWGRP